ncbi:hypothetical protein BB560_002570 [Smittium megazygosporum]|uniref:Alpha/beta hydrolase fold-3 domain-containing protein n=1 Tax=Smittium megazygosporum TaxID=133381 RepID=A0A2T9ZEE5_9FUNG|nr:hypothetical protein BB560_002570 [Smittium megazygosporum]
MTDLTRCVVNSKYKTPEHGKVLSDDISKVTAESVSSYFIDEPRYPPAGRLKRKSPPDLMCATFGAMRHTNTLKTNEGFGVAKIGNGMRIIRYIEIELADCPGKHKTEYWKGDHPSLYRWPHPFLDELMTQDAERIEQKKPRNPYSEIVVHNEVIGAAKNKGHSMDQIMSLAPLDESKYIVVFAPEILFTASLIDCYKFYLHLINVGYKSSNILIMVDSAGGNAVLNILMLLKIANKDQPKGAFEFSPWRNLA